MNVCILALALMVLILPGLAKARTFNLLNDDFALYVKGSVDTKSYKNTLVSDSNGAGINMDSEGTNKISGEFGIFFAEPKLNVRLGIEYLRPHALEDKQGLRATDDVLMYTMKSELSVLAPKIVVELNLQRSATSRLSIASWRRPNRARTAARRSAASSFI